MGLGVSSITSSPGNYVLDNGDDMSDSVKGQAGVKTNYALIHGVSEMIWQWEGSGELYEEFVERIVNYVLNGGSEYPPIALRESEQSRKDHAPM
jgi:hypothetical protein